MNLFKLDSHLPPLKLKQLTRVPFVKEECRRFNQQGHRGAKHFSTVLLLATVQSLITTPVALQERSLTL